MSEAAEVGSIVAYLTLHRGDWTAGVRETERDADRLGRLNPRIRIETNTGEVLGQFALVHAAERRVGQEADKAKPFVMNLWAALAAAGPAAVPVAAVAGGALLGLLPVLATVGLGIAGIRNEMKAGAVQGTQFANEVDQLKTEVQSLEQVAAGGLMGGITQGLQQSQPLWQALNQDIAVTSNQLGDIVAGAGPALLTILTQLQPLFNTIGSAVANGANALEHWTRSSDGVSQFVAYVQAELPDVEHLLAGVVTLVAHLFQASAGPGAALLHDLTLVVDALDAIPVDVLRVAIPLAISLYAALKAGQGVTAAVNAVNSAIESIRKPLLEANAAAVASSLGVQAAAAEEAAGVAEAKAAEAAAAAEAAVEIAAAEEDNVASLDLTPAAAAEAAIEFSAAMDAEAAAARAAAVEIAASARAAATASREAGTLESAGLAGMLGPMAAVGVGVTLLTSLFLGNSSAAKADAQATNDYTQALIQSKGALTDSVRASVAKQLADQGLLAAAGKLGISVSDLTDAVMGNDAAMARVQKRYNDVATAVGQSYNDGVGAATGGVDDLNKALNKLHGGLTGQTKDFAKSRESARLQLQAMQQSTAAINTQQVAAAALYGLHGSAGVQAYLVAADAAKKNTDQTNAQTLAFQLENDAAGLVNQALQTMAGQNLSNAQAQTAMEQSILTVVDALKRNKGALSDHTKAGLEDRQAIEGAVSSIRAKMQAEASATGSTEKATAQYRHNAKALLEQIGRLDGTKSAAYRYAEQLMKIPPVVKTGIELRNAATAAANIAFIRQQLADLPSYKSIVVGISTRGSLQGTYNQQVPYAARHATGTGSGGMADGWAWVGDPGPHSELVHKQGSRVDVYPHGEALRIAAMMGMSVPAYASGTTGRGGPQLSFNAPTAARPLVARLPRNEPTLTLEVDRVADTLAKAVVRRLGLAQPNRQAGGAAPQIHVHPRAEHSEQVIGKVAANELLWYARR